MGGQVIITPDAVPITPDPPADTTAHIGVNRNPQPVQAQPPGEGEGFIDRMTGRFGANLRNTGQAIMHPLDTISSMLSAKQTPIDALSEQYARDPANLAGDVMTALVGRTVMGNPPGVNMAAAGKSAYVPEGVAHPLQGLQRGAAAIEPNLAELVKKPISSTLMAAPRAVKAALGDNVQLYPVDRPAPLWQQQGVTPTTPGFNWATSTPEEIQAQLQRMANRPRPSRAEGQPADIPQAPQVQNIPLPKQIGPTKASYVDPYREQSLPPMNPATSTTMEAHGYQPARQEMYAHFKNGNVYRLSGVPQEIYDQFQNAESQGSFYANNLKGRYQTDLVGKVKPTKPSPGQQVRTALRGQ